LSLNTGAGGVILMLDGTGASLFARTASNAQIIRKAKTTRVLFNFLISFLLLVLFQATMAMVLAQVDDVAALD